MIDDFSDANHVEVQFRDGIRWMPRYIADRFPEDIYTMTYAEAMAWYNQRQFADHVNQAQDRIIADHFRRQAGG